jgi:transglutaminase-like putative cysteine protease
MWLRVEHTTSYTYDAPVAEAYTELRLRPLADGGQHCSSFRLETTPPGLRVREYRDHFGNDVLHLDVLEPHDRLEVTAISEVMTPESAVHARRPPGPLERHDFLMPTGYAPHSDRVRAFAGEQGASGESAAERACELMGAIKRELAYEPGATDVRTRADEALELGRGVCQDFAHILLAACRLEGIPARYVSGYLHDPALDGGHAASHAWVDAWDEEHGWVSLDPTHDREQNADYVRVAVGRDYADVPPTRGVYRGGATERLHVSVKLHRL